MLNYLKRENEDMNNASLSMQLRINCKDFTHGLHLLLHEGGMYCF